MTCRAIVDARSSADDLASDMLRGATRESQSGGWDYHYLHSHTRGANIRDDDNDDDDDDG